MRILRVLPLILTVALLWLLDHPIGALPALGRLIDPVNGAMVSAEPADKNFNRKLQLKELLAPVEIWLEDRLVPHIRAQNDHDLYYMQGYVHAYFRLWQMDLQTRAAGGRVSEVAGEKALEFDRGQRRKGMVFAAARSLQAIEGDPRSKAMLDAYTTGVNAYIATLGYRDLPLEYKLMGFAPERWTALRSVLLMKYMADDLTGKTDDIAFTILRDQLGQEQFDFLYPEKIKGSKPVIPEGTKFAPPSLPQPKYPGDSVWTHFGERSLPASPGDGGGARKGIRNMVSRNVPDIFSQHVTFPLNRNAPGIFSQHVTFPLNRNVPGIFSQHVTFPLSRNIPGIFSSHVTFPLRGKEGMGAYANENTESETAIGSNNWAISGAHTASGKPILCNDPHLALNLPSLWFEMQLSAPGINTYGASLPGAPGVVIGFNNQISWGFTNNYRDVKDYYDITSLNNDQYLFNGKPVSFQKRIERIGVKGRADVMDTVLYTIHGPVQYDASFPDPAKSGKRLAMSWIAHRGTNELLSVYLLNRAADYNDFVAAIRHFECPAQNFAYADKGGNIAMWGQGRFINKWRGQGKYVMEGRDSLTLWGQDIPMAENPHVLNPPQGYVASANQSVTDSTYPYWYNGSFTEWRSWRIHEVFGTKSFFASGPFDNEFQCNECYEPNMQNMQNDDYSVLAEKIVHLIQPYGRYSFRGDTIGYYKGFWSLPLNPITVQPTVFQIWWNNIYKDIWQDEFPNLATKYPSTERTMQLLLSDSASEYYDDKKTQQVETLRDIIQRAFRETTDSLDRLKRSTGLEWYKVKNTSLTHLAKIPAFSYDHLKIGGWSNTINAASGNHGPSWRMIVEMGDSIRAYAVYPGGQSGNPGSPHYGDFIDYWVAGKYYPLHFLTKSSQNPFKYTWTLTP